MFIINRLLASLNIACGNSSFQYLAQNFFPKKSTFKFIATAIHLNLIILYNSYNSRFFYTPHSRTIKNTCVNLYPRRLLNITAFDSKAFMIWVNISLFDIYQIVWLVHWTQNLIKLRSRCCITVYSHVRWFLVLLKLFYSQLYSYYAVKIMWDKAQGAHLR